MSAKFPRGGAGSFLAWSLVAGIGNLDSVLAEAELRQTFPSELSCGSATLPWHYPQNGVVETEIHEDIPLNSGIAELFEDIFF